MPLAAGKLDRKEPDMRIRVLKPFDYTPSEDRRLTYAYQPSEEAVTVKAECGEAAVARGDAEAVDEPAKAPSARGR